MPWCSQTLNVLTCEYHHAFQPRCMNKFACSNSSTPSLCLSPTCADRRADHQLQQLDSCALARLSSDQPLQDEVQHPLLQSLWHGVSFHWPSVGSCLYHLLKAPCRVSIPKAAGIINCQLLSTIACMCSPHFAVPIVQTVYIEMGAWMVCRCTATVIATGMAQEMLQVGAQWGFG